jgi:hypothetical protein
MKLSTWPRRARLAICLSSLWFGCARDDEPFSSGTGDGTDPTGGINTGVGNTANDSGDDAGDGATTGGSGSSGGITGTTGGSGGATSGPASTGGSSTGISSNGDGGTDNDPPIFDPIVDYGSKGPFSTTTESSPAGCLIYRPMVLGEKGRRHPVIVWGNGTGTPTATVYAGLFQQWASHGFIVAAANTPNAGTSKEMLACLDWVEAQDAVGGSAYEKHVALGKAGASGHSQGGGGAIMAGRDARIVTTIPFQPYTLGLGHDAASQSQQHGPMFMISGTADVIAVPAQNQAPVFAACNAPIFWGNLVGGDHVTIALGTVKPYLAPSTAWWLLQLANDENARAMFYGTSCTLCSDTTWQVMQKGL